MIGDVMIRHEVLGWLGVWVLWPASVFVPLGLPIVVAVSVLIGVLAHCGRVIAHRFSRRQIAARKAWRPAFNAYLSQRGNYALCRPAPGRHHIVQVLPEQWFCHP
jgi:hypothetical protein